ncbi:MAG: ATP-grasp fold amidoligase family protein [Gammaproteobacteria bacterium]
MIEEFLVPMEKIILPKDYKCYVFDGQVKFISVINRAKMERMWYTGEWEPVTFDPGHTAFSKASIESKPEWFNGLIDYAEKLGKNYGHAISR